MTLDMIECSWLNIVAIIAGGLAYFMLGGLWYMKLFSKRWLDAVGRTAEDFKDGGAGATMLLTLVGCLVTTAVLALVYGWAGGETVLDGLVIGCILGAGVAAMEAMKGAVYNVDERVKPWALYAINGAYAVCGLMLAGLVYALIV
ncbi:hypothetical protein CWE09_07425 [Aliidiomarina minuta]|uniref:DUF1761 domain-containing protein n=1 Tax=Aliidiomarina minuta TaxID=880057 RepID=A0A432W8X3_9GAMM|nr:DUF1761 domain-containing protein [Aliidiomarina minuta]RUO26529.1 hypothetical protein CWE09_07425 [Aliidiomarina minuta]